MRFLLSSILTMIFMGLVPGQVLADAQSLNDDYRAMIFNYHLIAAIAEKCPAIDVSAIESRSTVEEMMQKKLGTELYIQTMIGIQKSGLRNEAQSTATNLLERLTGCDDVRLGEGIKRTAEIHNKTFERFKNEPVLVKPRPVPIPMRQRAQ